MEHTVTLIPGEGIGPELPGPRAAERIEAAVEKVYREGRWLMGDIGGKATTAEFARAVIEAVAGDS